MTQPPPYQMYPAYTPPAPRPPRTPRQKWLIRIAIIVGPLVLIGLVAAGTGALQSLLHRNAPDTTLASGSPGPTAAASPLDCPGQCFTESIDGQLIPNYPVLTALGASYDLYPPGTYDPTTAGALYRADLAGWRANDGFPDQCFFAPANSPADSAIADGRDQVADPIAFIGTWSDKSKQSFVDVSSRVFPDSASASAYLAELAGQIADCHRIEFGTESHRFVVTLQPSAAITLPDSIASTGWDRLNSSSNPTRAYVTDLQRGNLVVRLRVVTGGDISEARFRSFVTTFAQTQLAQLQPTPAAG